MPLRLGRMKSVYKTSASIILYLEQDQPGGRGACYYVVLYFSYGFLAEVSVCTGISKEAISF